MSVQELREHIAQISTEIALQKEVLNKLERDKSLLQQQLNAVLDPMARLPLELSSEIFLQSLPIRPEPGSLHTPMLFLNICNSWTAIALSTPDLWTTIHIVFPCAKGLKEVLPIWLRRAGNRPLSISLEGNLNKAVTSVIWGHALQLKHFEICGDREEDDEGPGERHIIDFSRDIVIPESMPLLEALKIRSPGNEDWDRGYSAASLLELLRRAPNLVECTFERKLVHDIDDTEILVLPNLRRLKLGGSYQKRKPDTILGCLSLPALETLSIAPFGSDYHLLSLLTRSSPPLRELIFTRGVSDCLAELFHLVPALTRLEIWSRSDAVPTLSAALVDSPFVVPNLCSLSIHLSSADNYDALWQVFLHALSVRRTQLHFVNVRGPYYANVKLSPSEDTLAAFRELAADGMQLYIGGVDGTSNLLS